MSMLLNILKSSACRSNHHRLAIDALTQLRGTDGELWRNLFLHYYPDYLEGAKAPDEVFKDFKNHVLHVREGDWGGAPAATREWYRRTVRALAQQDWKAAVYCAGVMSHYAVDPLQPFHTGQTEEEGIIHRAVEWSLSKSYDELLKILVNDLGGYTDVPVPTGNDWLEQMIKAGAKTSNPHYETLIDHYNFEVGAKTPELGCDQEMKDAVAKLIGYATVMLARILEKAFVEAAVVPPKVGLTLDTIVATIKAPLRTVLAALDNEKERDLVRAMYNEFDKTGKVRQTLPEDDRQVRRLHAIEVLKVPLSTLDASWPRETGTAHGTGRPERVASAVKQKSKPKHAVKERKHRIEPTPAALEGAAVPKAAPKPQRVKAVSQAVEDASRTPLSQSPMAQSPTPQAPTPHVTLPQPPAPQPAVQQQVSSAAPPGKLRHDSPVEQAPSIGPKTASRLTAIGIHTVEDLLAASPEDAANRLKFKHINARLIRDWQAQAALACSIPKLNSLAAQLMVAVGVRDTDDLANADPEMLINMIDEFCETQDGQRIVRDGTQPEEDQVKAWVEAAQEILTRNAA